MTSAVVRNLGAAETAFYKRLFDSAVDDCQEIGFVSGAKAAEVLQKSSTVFILFRGHSFSWHYVG